MTLLDQPATTLSFVSIVVANKTLPITYKALLNMTVLELTEELPCLGRDKCL